MTHPQDYEETRIIQRRVTSASDTPDISVPSTSTDSGTFKNEITINSYGNSDLVNDAPGIYLRVGTGTQELVADKLIRIGPAIVTDDLNTATSPTLPYDANLGDMVQTGTAWLRKTDGAYFVHDGNGYVRVTPIAGTRTQQGIVRLAEDVEVLAGTETEAVVTPSSLRFWAQQSEVLSQQHTGRLIYVDQEIGDDSLENDGLDIRSPYLTINRALLEVSRRSFIAGNDNDLNAYYTVMIGPGTYLLDNRPGSTNYLNIIRQLQGTTGPINPATLANTVTAINFDAQGQTILSVTDAETEGITVNSQIWSSSGGTGVVVSVSDVDIVVKRVSGDWIIGDNVSFADYSVYNSTLGGVIVPRGCSIVGVDLRKVLIQPRFLGDFDAWEQSITGCTCNYVGGTSRFKVTGTSYIANLTLIDHPTIKETHHICTAFEFASTSDISDPTYGYYLKVYQGLGNTVDPNVVQSEFEPDVLETSIVSPALTNTFTDGDGFLLLDSVDGASPYISNVSLRSEFGARGLRIDGNAVNGFKSFVVERFTNISLQNDERAFEAAADAPANKQYKDVWRHASFEAINDGYAQLVSCFTICSGAHYRVASGGELSLANCFTNFGDIAFVADGFSSTILPQDIEAASLTLITPKPINSPTQEIPLGTFKPVSVEGSPVIDKLYVQESELDEGRLAPFSLLGDEQVFIKLPEGGEFSAELVSTAPFYGIDVEGPYINVKTSNNTISTETVSNLDSLVIFIRRTPDLRQQDDRIYWLQVEGLTPPKRIPQRNYVLRFSDNNGGGLTMTETLFIAEVRDTDSQGNPLNSGIFQIAILSGEGTNDSLSLLYPDLNVDSPVAASPTSKTYLAANALLESLGLGETQRATLLTPSDNPVDLIDPVEETAKTYYFDFARPSTIRAFGTGIEYIGYLNYSSSLPKYQDHSFSLASLFTKIKKETQAGRVYNVGMTDQGLFILGDQVIDLRDGSETNLAAPFAEENKVLKNLTITNRLFMYPLSTADFNGAKINFDINTLFVRDILPTFAIYANDTKGGFVRFATPAEANALTENNLAITPATIPISSFTQQGISRFATQVEADALTDTTLGLTPGTLPTSSDTQIGVTRFATQVEADALTDNTVALTPGTLPISSDTQAGAVELATQAEADALTDNTKVITPATLPEATDTQKGIVRFATNQQVENYVDEYVTLKPSQIRDLVRQLKEEEIGVIKAFAGANVPDGYLLCQGQEISRTTYSELFNTIGTVWGDGDGSTTFNLPPAESVLIGASGNIGYNLGDTGGANSKTVSSTSAGSHNHSTTTTLAGAANPTVTIALDGGHTPSITVTPDGAHTHTLLPQPAGGLTPTGNIQPAGAHFPPVVVLPDGSHAHTTTITSGGAFTPTGTVGLGGAITPNITVVADGAHDHVVTVDTWGPFTLSSAVTGEGGAHTPSITVNTAGDHTHTLTINEDGEHNHVLEGGFGVGGGGGATAYADAAVNGQHTHTGSAATSLGHTHGLLISEVAAHTHVVAPFNIPSHTHVVDVLNGGAHTHGLSIANIDAHSHPLTMNPIPLHDHVADTATAGAHAHNLQISEVPDHAHTLVMDAIPAHNHTGDTATNLDHTHVLVIDTVPDHTHTGTVSSIPNHSHDVTTATEGGHTHSTTVDVRQPYMAVNFIIYTGVFS